MRPVLITLTLASFVVVARADLPVGAKAPPLGAGEWLNAEAPKLDDLRGMIVVLYFWDPLDASGGPMTGFINALDNNPELGRHKGVVVIGLTTAPRKIAEPAIQSAKASFPVGCDAAKSAAAYQVGAGPHIVILDTKARVAYSGLPQGADDLVKLVGEAYAKTPPSRTHPVLAKIATENLAKAKELLTKKDYSGAYRLGRDAVDAALEGSTLHTECGAFVLSVDEEGRKLLAVAEEHVAGNRMAQAIEQLRVISREFKGMDVSRTADERLASLKSSSADAASLVSSEEAESAARAKLIAAQDLLRERQFGKAYRALEELSKKSADSEAGAAAGRIFARLKAQPKILGVARQQLADADCTNWLSEARTHIAARQSAKARELLQKIVDQYPDTTYADQALKELAKLR